MDSQLHCILLQGCDWRHLVRINWFLGKYQSPVEKSVLDHLVIDLTLYILYVSSPFQRQTCIQVVCEIVLEIWKGF